MKIIKFMLSLIAVIASTNLYANESNWVLFATDVGGHEFRYDYSSLKREAFPPVIATVKIFMYHVDKTKQQLADTEFRCDTKEFKYGQGLPIFVGDEFSIRRMLLEGFCGIRDEEGLWFVVGALADSGGYAAVNTNTVRQISEHNFSFSASQLNYQSGWGKFEHRRKYVVSCKDHSQATRYGDDDQTEVVTMDPSSPLRVIREMVCTGYIPPTLLTEAIGAMSNSTDTKNLDDGIDAAKNTCVELGFKPKSERFANCVLKVSR